MIQRLIDEAGADSFRIDSGCNLGEPGESEER